MEEKTFSKIVNRGGLPTRADIAELLKSIGEPGEKRQEKVASVRRLFDELGQSGYNFQGHHVADDLHDYLEY